MTQLGRAASIIVVCSVLSGAPASAAFECTPQTPVRLCLTMEIRSAIEKSSSGGKSFILASLATMQAADGRSDLAYETTRLAHAAAVAQSDAGWSLTPVAKPAALGDIAAVEADAAAIADPQFRASYLIAVIENLPASTDAAAVERLVGKVRADADAVGQLRAAGGRGLRFSRPQLYFLLARALAEAGRIDLALAQNTADPPNPGPRSATPATLVEARLKKGAIAEAEELAARLAPADDSLWSEIAGALVKDGKYAVARNLKADYPAALALLARHPGAASDHLLTLAKLGVGDFAGALDAASTHVEPSEEWAYVWSEVTVALAAAGRIEEAMTAATRATDRGATTNAAVARALVRAGRRGEARKYARSAFEAYVMSDPEFGDRNLLVVAEAFLLADDVPGAIAASGPRCEFHLLLTMADDALKHKDRKRAGAILAGVDKPLMACIEKRPDKTTYSEDPEYDDSAARRFLCQFALTHSRRETLAKLAAVDGGFRRARGDHGQTPLLWDDAIRAKTYGCIAVATAQSEYMAAARAFAASAPTPDASFEALVALAGYAVEEAPVAAPPLIQAVALAGDDGHKRVEALTGVTDALSCRYRDRPVVGPIRGNARCRTHQL